MRMNERENFINNLERAINLAYGEGREFVKLTIGDIKKILQIIKDQEERLKRFELERSWDEHPDTMGK